MSRTHVSEVESGKRGLSLLALGAVVQFLGVSPVDQLMILKHAADAYLLENDVDHDS